MICSRKHSGAALLALGVLSSTPPAAHAQGTYEDPGPVVVAAYGGDLAGCMRRHDGGRDPAYDPDRDPGLASFQSPRPMIENVLFCADAFAGGTMRTNFGAPLFGALAVILVVWTGVTIMFSGRFDLAELLSTVLLIGFVAMLLWSFPIPGSGPPVLGPIWGTESFPVLVSSLGRDLSRDLVDDTWQAVNTSFRRDLRVWRAESVVNEALEVRCNSTSVGHIPVHVVNLSDECRAYLGAKSAQGTHLFIYGFFFLIAVILGVIPVLVALFSMLWGYFSLAVLTLVGPIMIPWGLIPQTSFLMWGWIRAVVASTVQMIVGAVVFVIVATLILTPLEKYSNSIGALVGAGAELSATDVWSRGGSMFLEFLPLAVVAILGAFKAGEITNMIMSGGGVPSSGLSDRMQGGRGVASGVAGAAAGTAAVAGAGLAIASGGISAAAQAGGRVLSAATRAAGRGATG